MRIDTVVERNADVNDSIIPVYRVLLVVNNYMATMIQKVDSKADTNRDLRLLTNSPFSAESDIAFVWSKNDAQDVSVDNRHSSDNTISNN